MHEVFVYGTLLDSRVVEYVVGREIKPTYARVEGYRRIWPKHSVPFMVEDVGRTFDGVLLSGFSDHELLRLDQYEGIPVGQTRGGSYQRVEVEVEILKVRFLSKTGHDYEFEPTGRKIRAWMYAATPEKADRLLRAEQQNGDLEVARRGAHRRARPQ